jgi:hypothetical protein
MASQTLLDLFKEGRTQKASSVFHEEAITMPGPNMESGHLPRQTLPLLLLLLRHRTHFFYVCVCSAYREAESNSQQFTFKTGFLFLQPQQLAVANTTVARRRRHLKKQLTHSL